MFMRFLIGFFWLFGWCAASWSAPVSVAVPPRDRRTRRHDGRRQEISRY